MSSEGMFMTMYKKVYSDKKLNKTATTGRFLPRAILLFAITFNKQNITKLSF